MELTRMQNKIAELTARGYSEKEMADEMCVSSHTVKNHTANVRKKLNARSAVDVARWFILQLEDPKTFFRVAKETKHAIVVGFFLALQIHVVCNTVDFDLRRARTVRISKTVRTGNRKV